jgi:hypothetical protein
MENRPLLIRGICEIRGQIFPRINESDSEELAGSVLFLPAIPFGANLEFNMPGLEATPQVTELLAALVKKTKDDETQSLAQDIRARQLAMQTELAEARARIAKMEAEHAELHAQIADLKAKLWARQTDNLTPETAAILKFFFTFGKDLTSKNLAVQFKIDASMAEYHIDELLKKRFVTRTRLGASHYDGATFPHFEINATGRAYIMKNGLA